MLRCMKKPRSLKARHYTVGLIYLNDYLASFTGATMADKFGVNELNGILLNSMTSSWSSQSYVQGFDCNSISFKNSVELFERTEISEITYEGVVTPFYKKLLGQNTTVLE